MNASSRKTTIKNVDSGKGKGKKYWDRAKQRAR